MRSLTLLLTLLGTCLTQAADTHTATTPAYAEEARYLSTSGRFNIPVPNGWRNTKGENLGLRDNVFLHPKSFGGFTANVVFIEEPTLGLKNLSDLVVASLGNMKDIPGFKVNETQRLRTAQGESIVMVRYEGNFLPNGTLSNNAAYFIILKNERFLTITVSGTENTPEKCHSEAKAAILDIEISK